MTPNLFKRCACAKRCEHAYWYEFECGGRRFRKSTKTHHKEDAAAIAEQARKAAARQRVGLQTVGPAPDLQDFIVDYVEWAEQDHPASSEIDKRVLLAFSDVVGAGKALDAISAFDIERWRRARKNKIGRSTINRELNVVRGLFSKAVEWGKLHENPAKGVTNYRIDDTRIRVLAPEEIRLVLTQGSATLRLVCRVTLACLPRLNEVLNIHKTDIGTTWVQIRRKGGRVDRVAVSPALRKELWDRASSSLSGYVFRQRNRGAVSAAFTNEFRGLGLEGVSHHTMRHTGVTMMLEAGINPRVIQQLAGWTSLRMLARYGHTRDAEAQRAVLANDQALADYCNSPQKAPQDGAERSDATTETA